MIKYKMCKNDCKWKYDEPQAGLINYCGCEELEDEEYEQIQKGELKCPYFEATCAENRG